MWISKRKYQNIKDRLDILNTYFGELRKTVYKYINGEEGELLQETCPNGCKQPLYFFGERSMLTYPVVLKETNGFLLCPKCGYTTKGIKVLSLRELTELAYGITEIRQEDPNV